MIATKPRPGISATASRDGVMLTGIGHRFGRKTVVRDIDLELGPGVFGLLGPNGAGKTTLLKILATVQRPTEGDLRLLGLDPGSAHEVRLIRRQLGYLPQAFGYYPNFTVFEFIEYFALLKEMDPGRVRPAVAEAIQRVGLEERAKSKLKSLSGGMIRRVSIAQTIVNSPSLLILDKPMTGLDPEQRVRFRAMVREFGRTSTVIVTTHLVEDVSFACDGLVVMKEGVFRFRGTPDQLVALGPERSDEVDPGESSMERGYRLALAEDSSS